MASRLKAYGKALKHVEQKYRDRIEGLTSYLHNFKGSIFLIGNGGSATIAEHTALDFIRLGGLDARYLLNSPIVTMIANDYGFPRVFEYQIKHSGKAGDYLIAISSSGESVNIINAVNMANSLRMRTIALTGFEKGNRVHKAANFGTFHVPSYNYGVVEVTHQAILHAVADGLCLPKTN
jgi:D-sedoheptulose 7-phosphate isomerase